MVIAPYSVPAVACRRIRDAPESVSSRQAQAATRHPPKKDGLPKRELRKAKEPAARGWVSQAARAAGAAGEFVRPSIQVNAPISNSVVT